MPNKKMPMKGSGMEDLLDKYISSFSPLSIYLFLMIGAVAENLCPPIPGDMIACFGAFLAGKNKLSFSLSYMATTFGSWTGFMFMFWVGTRLRSLKKNKLPFFKQEHISKAEIWLKKYGYLIILVNRYIPAVRSVVSITAGILNLSPWKVMLASLVSCATWNMGIMYLGLKAGSNWKEIKEKVSYMLLRYNTTILLIILACLILILFKKRFLRKN